MTDIFFLLSRLEHLQSSKISHLDIMSLLFILLLELMAFLLLTTRKNVGLLFDVVLAECPISPDMINYIFAARTHV